MLILANIIFLKERPKMKKKYVKASTLGKKIIFPIVVSGMLVLQGCGGGDGSPRIKDGETITVLESSKGTVTEVEEVEPGDDFRIIDERIIDEKEKSIAIVHYLDGRNDTLSLQKLKSESKEGNHTNSALRGVLMYSLASSFFNRNLANTAPNAGYYKNAEAFNKSTGLKGDLEKSATSRRVQSPGKSSKGYGAGKSFRSHGG